MTAAIMLRSGDDPSGLRPVNPRRDMRAVADLIETAFSSGLDDEGRRMLRWMRILGRTGWLGWLLSWHLLPPAARPSGFVWEVDGNVVGNASLLKVDGHPDRWVLVNVAVHPQHQRKGIARSMVKASVDKVRRKGGKEIILQVDRDNRGAQILYASHGFRPLITRTTWVCLVDKTRFLGMETGVARKRKREEWQQQWFLSRRLHPEGLVWPYPPTANLFRPRGLFESFGLVGGWHWVWSEDGRLLASLTARWGGDRNNWRLILVVEPEARDAVEKGILVRGLTDLPSIGGEIVLDYPSGHAESQLKELGFFPRRTLTWMGCEIKLD